MKTALHNLSSLTDQDQLMLKHLCIWLEQRMDDQISMIQLVELSGLPYQELVRRFQIYTGTTPFQWLRQRRNQVKQHHHAT
jgi:AraC-like DNA-binding protein